MNNLEGYEILSGRPDLGTIPLASRHIAQLHSACLVRLSEAAVACTSREPDVLEAVRAATRRRQPEALLRQRVMYLAHVGLGVSLTATGNALGRDRTTVRHGCSLIEDVRLCPQEDQALAALEWGVRAQARMLLEPIGQQGGDAHD